ncbi:2-dehydro-3-deoxygalactonokinase [Geosporobacter subterraneus DSM 17957]|uniref:2-dehydro-3-deoxygalactonokinase n=1 Tax=Geosporobacter subterraneus DSM 17957 TaxID=1121919 RepID=A0A1M6EQS2_9FIRM|nr:2-dehydro-3-deoxygalactonokinase [Geosporobacter subterraneus]SHI87793.1 2-dehydro-3-deoxygalactonokinase [Geosporobacter subterraneus DSM 17957]
MGYITIDTGTTNTRIRYIEKDSLLGSYQEQVGVRDTAITGSLENLKRTIKRGIAHCLANSHRELWDVEKIIAFGMITSNLGLIEIPHLEAPVGLKELKKGIVQKSFQEIVDVPIYFIPGVKNKVENSSPGAFMSMDMMRGEETESIGALCFTQVKGERLYISPGSHTKFVFFDENHRIKKCSTTLAGELLWALASETILAHSIPKSLISSVEREYIEAGIAAVKKHGFTKTCFLVRSMDLFSDTTPNQRVNFIAGAIGYQDLKSIAQVLEEYKPTIIVGGKRMLRELYGTILEILGYDRDKIILLEDPVVEKASSIGALKILAGG